MITIMSGLPDNILGVFAEGRVTGKDYETVLIPALEEKIKTHKKIRFLYWLGEGFTGFELAAIADDAKVSMKHLLVWERVALVSDHEMLNAFMKFIGHVLPGETRAYKNAELEEAKKWLMQN